MNPPVAVTLAEGDYFAGVAALANSLVAAGYRGTLWVGCRGSPAWHGLRPLADGGFLLQPADGFEIRGLPVATGIHFTNHKPEFLARLWDDALHDAGAVAYIDPDVVVKCPWAFVTRWASDGLALCEDVNSPLPRRHPTRRAWTAFLARHGLPWRRDLDTYVNAGFIGLPREYRPFLDLWSRIVAAAGAETGALGSLKHADPLHPFHSADQDALNCALHATDAPVNAIGREGMDIIPGGNVLSHALGPRKPWRGRFLRDALHGHAPSAAARAFLAHAAGPVAALPPGRLRRLRTELRIAAALSRFYRRT